MNAFGTRFTLLATELVALFVLVSTIGIAVASSEVRELSLVVIHQKADSTIILALSDTQNGLRLSGLKPGEYTVQRSSSVHAAIGQGTGNFTVLPGAGAVNVKVGLSGRLAIALNDGARPAVEQIEFPPDAAKGSVLSASRKRLIDVNQSSADILLADTRNSNEAAALIIAERHRNGPYKNPQDFAQRICAKVDLDFEFARVQIGDTLVIPPSSSSAVAGFSCKKGGKHFQIFQHQFPVRAPFVFH